MKYVKRNITNRILKGFDQYPVVALTGARQTGKTVLCEALLPRQMGLAADYVSFDDPDERLRFQRNPIGTLCSFRAPLLVLDEAQKIPALFDPRNSR